MRQKNPLRELRGAVWPVEAETDPRRRERIAERIVALNRELAGQARRRRSLWWLSAAALIGGLCALIVLLRPELGAVGVRSSTVRLVFGAASVSRGGVLAPIGDGPIDVTAEPILVTRADQAAEFRLTSNTDLRLDAASEVGLERQRNALGFEEHVHLKAGSISLRVPKLGARNKLAVETRDSSIEVHGTQFSVRWVERSAQPAFTEVHVEEGKVLVRGRDGASRMLGAGDDWRSNAVVTQERAALEKAAQAPVVAPPEGALSAPAVAPEPGGAHAANARRIEPPISIEPARVARAAPSPSELAAQNRLLDGAELAQKSGMPALALQRLDTLIARFPEAELAQNARVQRMRLLASTGRSAEAARAARQYLERYPRGFAREEALGYLSPDQPAPAGANDRGADRAPSGGSVP